MKIKSYSFIYIISLGLSACGGGSSSGGADQSSDLTHCVSEVVEERVTTLTTNKDYTYTNNCGEPVNLSYVRTASTDISTISLAANGTHSDSSIFSLSYVACRPPSIGIDGDSETLFVQLEFS